MLTNLRSKIQKDEEGFTLVELMVVVLIMAILMAIAIPTFLGAQNKAKDSSTKADLRNAMTAAKSIAADQGGLFVSTGTTNLTASDLNTAEPSITFAAAATNAAVGVYPGTNGADMTFVKLSKGGKYFAITATSGGVTKSCSDDTLADIDSNSECVTSSATTSWTS
jgi:type IV pilus assembly protein PilA